MDFELNASCKDSLLLLLRCLHQSPSPVSILSKQPSLTCKLGLRLFMLPSAILRTKTQFLDEFLPYLRHLRLCCRDFEPRPEVSR